MGTWRGPAATSPAFRSPLKPRPHRQGATSSSLAPRADAGALMMNAAGARPGYLMHMLQGYPGITRCLLSPHGSRQSACWQNQVKQQNVNTREKGPDTHAQSEVHVHIYLGHAQDSGVFRISPGPGTCTPPLLKMLINLFTDYSCTLYG